MWFRTTPSELDFADSSPFRIANVLTIAAPPARVFELFATGEQQETWFQDFKGCRWDSPAPHGVGSTREITLKTLAVKERFLAWEPGVRMTFSIDAITVPLVKQMMEDMRFEPTAGGTRLVWHVHYEPTLPMRAVHPAARAVFGRMFRRSAHGLRFYAEANPRLAGA
jgi:uncharacterized protein YndB with AHSA1/START domain